MINMSDLNIMVLDDDDLFIKLVSLLLDNLGCKQVKYTQTIEDALKCLETFTPDLFILDINLDNNESGIEFAKMVNKDKTKPIIFITSNFSEDTYDEAKLAGPCQFLDKQLSELKLRQAIELTLLQSRRQETTTTNTAQTKPASKVNLKSGWFIKKGKYLKKVDIANIRWIESEGKYATVKTHDNSYIVNLSLKEVADRLMPYDFIRIHKSYVINKEKIQAIDLVNNVVKIEEHEIPIGRNYRTLLLNQLADF